MQLIKSFTKALILTILFSQSTVQANWLTDFCSSIWSNYKPYIAVSCMALAAGLHAYFYYQPQPAKTQKDIKSDIKLTEKISDEVHKILDPIPLFYPKCFNSPYFRFTSDYCSNNAIKLKENDCGTFKVDFHSEPIFEIKLKGYRIFWTHMHKTPIKTPEDFKKFVADILYCATTYFKKRVNAIYLPRFDLSDTKPILMSEKSRINKPAYTGMSNMPKPIEFALPTHAFALWIVRENEHDPFYGAIVTKDCWVGE